MTLRLTIQRDAWRRHVDGVAATYGDGLVAVVKGNGYGLGRPLLHREAARFGGQVCVGTVHELHDVPADVTPVVLTPTLRAPSERAAILTVGSTAHVAALDGWHGKVIVKLASSMRRYGATLAELAPLLDAVHRGGLHVHALALHLPLAGDDRARLSEIEGWLGHLPDGELWVSHLSPESFHALAGAQRDRTIRIRVGTALWHGIPRGPYLSLTADVLNTCRVRAGDVAGYHHRTVPFDGTLVAVSAGSAHGVHPFDQFPPDRRSPFHFARQRLTLLEPPHMHTSLVIVPDGAPTPQVGDRVDVQQPLIAVRADELEWH